MKRILLLVFCALSAYFTERLIGIQTHTLNARAEWASLKTGNSVHRLGLMGAGNYMNERQALAGEVLNLDPWFGFNDLVYLEPLWDFSEYRVNFKLGKDAFIWIYLDCGADFCNAVRISRTAFYPSGLFKLDYSGKFLARTELPLAGPEKYTFTLKKNEAGYTIDIGDGKNTRVDYSLPERVIRLSSGAHEAAVTAVEVDGKRIDFHAPFNTVRFLTVFAVTGVLALAIFVFYPMAALMNLLLVLGLVLLGFFFDKYYWSKLYVTSGPHSLNQTSTDAEKTFENFRRNIFGTSPGPDVLNAKALPLKYYEAIRLGPAPDKGKALMPQLLHGDGHLDFVSDFSAAVKNLPSKSLRIAFLGGSQTWGAGASQNNLTWPGLVVQFLQKDLGRTVTGFNFAVCGAAISDYEKQYPLIAAFKPDLLIVNFGVNDRLTEESEFTNRMLRLQEFAAHEKIPAVFSVESTNSVPGRQSIPKDPLIRAFAKVGGIPLLNLSEEFHSPEVFDSGLLFMDSVHLSDAGQKAAADYFVREIKSRKLIR